jgi:type IV pilus assembly protein PilQ
MSEVAPDAPAPLQVTRIDVREGAPGARVEVQSNEPLVWTSFPDAEGRLVVELPNATPAPGVGDVEPADGLVDRITVSEESAGRRSLTRLVIATREAVAHKLRAEGTRLIVELEPLGAFPADRPASLTFEPVAEEEEMAPVAQAAPPPSPRPTPEPMREPVLEPVAPSAGATGTPDEPRVGPAPMGAPASSVSDIQVETGAQVTAVEIRGDGEFAYSTFRLSDPERFVVDLPGVINRSNRSAIPVSAGPVERIRVAQFKPFPEPVARVVFDLREQRQPQIERTPDALVVRFADGAEMAAMPPPAMAPPPPPPPMRPSPPPPEPDLMRSAAMERPQEIEITEVPAPPVPARPMVEAPPPRATPAPSDASVFGDDNEVRVGRPEERDDRGLFFGTRAVGGEREYFGEPIDMSLKDADVVETIRSFAQISGLNIVIQPQVSGRVTVELHNVPWDQALEQILRIQGLGYEVEGNIMRIAPLALLRSEAQERQQLVAAQALSVPLETVMKRLSYTSAQNIAGILRRSGSGGILSQRANVIVDQRTNTLIISELPEYMDTVLSIINNLDEPEPQVMIEARIIETTKRFSRELGIDWGFDLTAGPATGNSTGLEFPNNIQSSGSVELGTSGRNGLLGISLGNILDTFRLDAVLNAAEEDGLVNILSTPKVATLNNRQAIIQSGLQVPIQTVANNTVTVQFVNATLRLEVTPQITADGTVVMDIHIQKREVQSAFLVPGATNAPIATKEAQTQVLVRDGGTAVIGGIYEVSTDQNQNRVPGLASIPILGHLFRNNERTDENEELLIFITPRVVRL